MRQLRSVMHFVHVPREEPEDLLIHRISGNISTVKGFRDKKEQNRSLDRREILYWSRGYSLRSWIKGVLNHWHTIGHTLLAVCTVRLLSLFYHR